jgi:hypothetical protein
MAGVAPPTYLTMQCNTLSLRFQMSLLLLLLSCHPTDLIPCNTTHPASCNATHPASAAANGSNAYNSRCFILVYCCCCCCPALTCVV